VDPKFSAPIANVTVPVGREGVMTCTVHDLYKYKVIGWSRFPHSNCVAWLRVDTQTILTIETLVITKSERIAITHTEQRIWQLRIKDIRESDKGWYMCQINTDPMKSQMGYLDVCRNSRATSWRHTTTNAQSASCTTARQCVEIPFLALSQDSVLKDTCLVPRTRGFPKKLPKLSLTPAQGVKVTKLRANTFTFIATDGSEGWFSDGWKSHSNKTQDMVVLEGANVTLTCAATGVPEPTVNWKREGDKSITSVEDSGITSHDGAMLHIYHIQRHNAGSYHCIASNGVPPTVSKRIIVTVNFQPIVRLPTRQYYAELGGRVTLECHSEAQPNSINYWMKGKGEIILQGGTYDSTLEDHVFKVTMRITIRLEKASDYGVYKCVAKNSLGTTEESVRVYR
ncbi:AGAP008776-PA, partial [Anopheles gambiae str. PEST]